MRRSRDSLDTILQEREEGVGAESPRPQTELQFKNFAASTMTPGKPTYGFKIALVSASRRDEQAPQVVAVGLPVGERDGDPEGCSSVDEQQVDVVTQREELSGKRDSESEAVMCQGRDSLAMSEDQLCTASVQVEKSIQARSSESCSAESGLNPVCQDEKIVESVSSCELEVVMRQSRDSSVVSEEQLHAASVEVESISKARSETCSSESGLNPVCQDEKTVKTVSSCEPEAVMGQDGNSSVMSEEQLSTTLVVHSGEARLESCSSESCLNPVCQDDKTVESVSSGVSALDNGMEAITAQDTHLPDGEGQKQFIEVNLADSGEVCFKNTTENGEESSCITEHDSTSDHRDKTAIQEPVTESVSVSSSQEQNSASETANENLAKQHLADKEELSFAHEDDSNSDHRDETVIQEPVTESASVASSEEQKSTSETVSDTLAKQHLAGREEFSVAIEDDCNSDHRGETVIQVSVTKSDFVTNSQEQKTNSEAASENVANQDSVDREELCGTADVIDIDSSNSDHKDETAVQETATVSTFVTNSQEQKSTSEAAN